MFDKPSNKENVFRQSGLQLIRIMVIYIRKGEVMKKIYIILTHTGTTLSKIIKTYTRCEFSHVSIALDEDLNRMYSFGRLHAYNPFWGGFVHEEIDKGTFKRFKNTGTRVYSLEISNEQYELIEKEIEKFEFEKKKYKFNILGLIGVVLKRKMGRKNAFYCAEFVKHIIETAQVTNDLPIIIKPEDFKKIKGLEQIYTGLLREYKERC